MLCGTKSSVITLMSSEIGYVLFYSIFCDTWTKFVNRFDNNYVQDDFTDYFVDITHKVSRNRNEEGFVDYQPCEVDGFVF